jgi:hypothetical protein
VRNPDGTVHSVTATQQNFGSATVSGLDIGWSGTFGSRAGTFGVGALATYLAQHDSQIFAGGDVQHLAGSFSPSAQAYPRWRALAHVDWQRGGWRASYAVQLIGSYVNCGYGVVDQNPICQSVGGLVYQDVAAGYSWESKLDVRLGISDLTNRQPPFVNGADTNTDTATYRLLGRTFFADLRASFR